MKQRVFIPTKIGRPILIRVSFFYEVKKIYLLLEKKTGKSDVCVKDKQSWCKPKNTDIPN